MAKEFSGIDVIRRENTKALMSEAGLSRKEFSEQSGIDYGLLGHYIGKNPTKRIGDETAQKVEKFFKKPKNWLDHDHASDKILDQIRELDNVRVDYGNDDDSGDIRIPIYDVYFCCGDGDAEEFAFEEVKGERKFPPHFFTDKGVKPENFKLVCAKNDSQKPYINEHDIVGIDISDREIKDGEMYAILLDGERMFKRIFREPGNVLRLHCYNPDYPDKIVTADNHSSLVIVGREMYRAG